MIDPRRVIAPLALLLLAASGIPAHAAMMMNYGDFLGTDVVFRDVTEDTSEPVLLFGAPTVSGNQLVFTPDSFEAQVDPGPGSLVVDNLVRRYGIEVPERHTAAGDALATALLFQRLLKKAERRGIHTLGDLLSR